jgi:hypothetical protein
VWDDTKLALKHYSGEERVAFVSAIEWIRWAVKIFELAMPRHVRVLQNRDLAEAMRWVGE